MKNCLSNLIVAIVLSIAFIGVSGRYLQSPYHPENRAQYLQILKGSGVGADVDPTASCGACQCKTAMCQAAASGIPNMTNWVQASASCQTMGLSCRQDGAYASIACVYTFLHDFSISIQQASAECASYADSLTVLGQMEITYSGNAAKGCTENAGCTVGQHCAKCGTAEVPYDIYGCTVFPQVCKSHQCNQVRLVLDPMYGPIMESSGSRVRLF